MNAWRDFHEETQWNAGAALDDWKPYAIGRGSGQVLDQWPDEQIGATLVELATATAGATAGSGEFRDIIAPGETRARQHEMEDQSTCALAVRGWLRLLGVISHRLAPPYRTGAAFFDVQTLAGTEPVTTERLRPGAIAVFGTGRLTHMALVQSFVPQTRGKWLMRTLDGGQKDSRGRECIQWRDRQVYFDASNRLIVRDWTTRQFVWVLHPAKLRALMLAQWRMPRRDLPPVPQPAMP